MQAKVLSGIDQLHLMDQIFSGKRLAVVTGGGAVNRDLVSTLDVLTSRYQVVKLFNTIYGIRGEFRYGEDIPYYVDEKTGLGVHSIFNIERTAPTEEMLQDVDMLVFDIRGAGTRFFEYIHCLGSIMKACARYQKPVTVLDRIAPLGGEIVEGTVCPPSMHTIVGDYELPSRFALTMGEFAQYINGEFSIGCDLTVIPVEGWTREMYYDETDVPWLLPSPSLNSTTANLLYAGFCIFEGISTISEGRGTSKPFELIGAPWLNTSALVDGLKSRHLDGVRFAPTYFRPQASKHNGQVCNGVQVLVDDRKSFRPFLTALTMFEIIRDLHPGEIAYRDCSAGHCVKEEESSPVFTRYIDKLLATDAFSQGRMTAQQLVDHYAPERERFIQRKAKYHLYG